MGGRRLGAQVGTLCLLKRLPPSPHCSNFDVPFSGSELKLDDYAT